MVKGQINEKYEKCEKIWQNKDPPPPDNHYMPQKLRMKNYHYWNHKK